MKRVVTPGGRAGDLNWELMLNTSASHTETHTLVHLDSYLLKGTIARGVASKTSYAHGNLIK